MQERKKSDLIKGTVHSWSTHILEPKEGDGSNSLYLTKIYQAGPGEMIGSRADCQGKERLKQCPDCHSCRASKPHFTWTRRKVLKVYSFVGDLRNVKPICGPLLGV